MADAGFVYLSQERIIEIEQEVKVMKTEGRKNIAEKIADARAHGDLSENAEYDAAKEEQGLFELRIHKLEQILARARVIDASKLPKDKIHILAKISIKDLNSQKMLKYQIVSPEEADFDTGKIAVTSPLGKGLINKAVGEQVEITTPAGIKKFEILTIE